MAGRRRLLIHKSRLHLQHQLVFFHLKQAHNRVVGLLLQYAGEGSFFGQLNRQVSLQARLGSDDEEGTGGRGLHLI